MKRIKPSTALKFSGAVHLVLCLIVVACILPPGTTILLLDQLAETFEYIYSPLPYFDAKMVIDSALEGILLQITLFFIITAVPCYVIGYRVYGRHVRQAERRIPGQSRSRSEETNS